MPEVVTSLLNKNTILYGNASPIKNDGPACIDRRGEDVFLKKAVPKEAPIKAVREK